MSSLQQERKDKVGQAVQFPPMARLYRSVLLRMHTLFTHSFLCLQLQRYSSSLRQVRKAPWQTNPSQDPLLLIAYQILLIELLNAFLSSVERIETRYQTTY